MRWTGSIRNSSWARDAINPSRRVARFQVNDLLDTNACIALINGNSPSVRAKFRKATDLGGQVFVSSIALFELWYGVAKSSRRDFNKKRLEIFFAGPIHPLSLRIRMLKSLARSELIWNPSESRLAYDLLVAGQAIRNKVTLITANLSEFARIKELAWADWGRHNLLLTGAASMGAW